MLRGDSNEDHNRCLIRCLEKAQKTGTTLNDEKCKFKEIELIYTGQTLTVNGIEPDESKIKSILETPRLENKKDV